MPSFVEGGRFGLSRATYPDVGDRTLRGGGSMAEEPGPQAVCEGRVGLHGHEVVLMLSEVYISINAFRHRNFRTGLWNYIQIKGYYSVDVP